MKVLIIGLPYFSNYIQDKLSSYYPEVKFIKLNTYYSRKDRLSYLVHLINADVVYSINGVTHGSNTIDLALKLNKRIVYHWVGSDLINAKLDFEKGLFNPNYIAKGVHLADSPWFVSELEAIGIKADYKPLNAFNDDLVQASSFPKEFVVLTYIKEGKELFYGLDLIIDLAKAFPNIQFRIAGMEHYKEPLPDNIQLLGWVSDMKSEIQKSTICIRMPKHDGLSFFVIEALGEKRYVIYNQEFKPSEFAYDIKEAKELIQQFYNRYTAGDLELNHYGYSYIQKHFNEKHIVSGIYNVLKSNNGK